MASVSKTTNNSGETLRTIQFKGIDGKRRSIRLGTLPESDVNDIRDKVALLETYAKRERAPDRVTAAWLGTLGDAIYDTLAAGELVEPRPSTKLAKAKRATLGPFLDSYIAKRSDVKGGTAVVYGHTRRCLVDYFGAEKSLAAITPADADDWRRWLALAKNEDDPQAGGQGLSDNTVRRRCGIARQFFRDAVRRRLIGESPFAEMQGVVVRSNRSRHYFVSRADAAAVLKACPDSQWKLLFALSRYGGLRCPSEHLALTWGDVDFEAGRIRIHSPKTEHHEGKGERIMPLFPELRPHLEAVRDELLADFDPKRKRLSEQPVITRYRDANANLRTQLIKIIRRAGLKPWPKLFQNLRATRATELADEYPSHVAAEWLGHTETIADNFYRQTTDKHFAKAVGEAVQKAVHSCAVTRLQGDVTEPLYCDITGEYDELRYFTVLQVGDTGLETIPDSSGKTQVSTQAVQKAVQVVQLPPGLASVVRHWPSLPLHSRRIIVGMARKAAERIEGGSPMGAKG